MNILGIWDGHDSGAALLQDGRLRFAVNEERLSRRKLEVCFPAQSIAACLAQTSVRPEQIQLVAASTSDPAKTLGRLWPGSKERYYAVRRRKAFPGPIAGLTRSLKYRVTEWAPGSASRALSTRALKGELARHGARACRSPAGRSSRGACRRGGVGVGVRVVRGRHHRRSGRRSVGHHLQVRRRPAGARTGRRRRAARLASSSSTSPTS